MPRVYIPAQLRDCSAGTEKVDVEAGNLREVIEALDEQFPGIAARLLDEGRLAAGIAADIDGAVATAGLMTRVGAASEIHFLPAIGGG